MERDSNETWITERMTSLKQLYIQCKDTNEYALSSDIVCMMRLLNGLSHMKFTQFHYYERYVFWKPLNVFSNQFLEQVEVARRSRDEIEKKELILDIEEALSEIYHAYRDIVDSKKNADRQMSSGWAINANIYDLSPKWCYYYTRALTKIVALFQGDSDEYVFILYPTLTCETCATALLKQREKSGKVVVISISEYMIEAIDCIPVFLVHESFHILTRKQKQLNFRARQLLANIVDVIDQYLFDGVTFFKREPKEGEVENAVKDKLNIQDGKVKDCLMERWLGREVDKIYEEVKQTTIDDERALYSNRFVKRIQGKIGECLSNAIVTAERDVIDICFEVSESCYKDFSENMANFNEGINAVRVNLCKLIANNHIADLCTTLANVFREVYADIACALTLNIKASDFERAFEKSMQFVPRETYIDMEKELRFYVVANAVQSVLPDGEKEGWKEKAQTLKAAFFSKSTAPSGEAKAATELPFQVTETIIDSYRQYAEKSARSFKQLLDDKDDQKIEELRAMLEPTNGDYMELMQRVFQEI